MSRYFNSFMDDSSEDLEHSWGTSPRAKAREKEYNHWYYQKHKDEIAAIRKKRHAATNAYKQAEKSYDDTLRYLNLSDKLDARIKGYHQLGPSYKDSDGNYHTIYSTKNPVRLSGTAKDSLYNEEERYERMATESEGKIRKYKIQGSRLESSARSGAKRILRDMKNPTAKDLVEFYFDTTVAKAKKSASKAAKKAKKYATKAMSTAEKEAKKYATKAMPMAEKAANKAKKYATKVMSSAEKEANKAKRYATKAIKSVVR